MKALFTISILLFSMMSYGQNYTVKGIVINSDAAPVPDAHILAQKSKTKATTTKDGVYEISVSPKEKELTLYINEVKVMSMPVSAEIAKKPIAFQMDSNTDPVKTGYIKADKYYPGSEDMTISDIIQKIGSKYRYREYQLDGQKETISSIGLSPKEIAYIKIITDKAQINAYGNKSDVIFSITSKAFLLSETSKGKNAIKDDSIRGTVKDAWGRSVGGAMISTEDGENAVSDTSGHYALKIGKKDKKLRVRMPYTEGTVVRIKYADRAHPLNLSVMLYQNDLRGWWSEDMQTYYPGEGEESWKSLLTRFNNVSVRDDGCSVYNNRTRGVILYVEVDGSAVEDVCKVNIKSVYSVRIIKDMAESLIYGGAGQFGAIIIKTKAFAKEAPVERTDWEAIKAKRTPGEEGLKKFINTQGNDLVYSDGKIIIDGKTCELYIINDKEFSHMRGTEANMIDDIIIIRTGGTTAYGEKAKNGVVLISASGKEFKAVNEKGETVTGKEAKKNKKGTKTK